MESSISISTSATVYGHLEPDTSITDTIEVYARILENGNPITNDVLVYKLNGSGDWATSFSLSTVDTVSSSDLTFDLQVKVVYSNSNANNTAYVDNASISLTNLNM